MAQRADFVSPRYVDNSSRRTPAETTSLPDFRGLSSSVNANATYFFLEDMEDGQFDVPGATYAGNGQIRTESGRNGSAASGVTGPNSVDEDNDSGVNNEGRQPTAGSFRQNPGQVGFIDFNASELGGNLPTHVGIVAMALESTFPRVTLVFNNQDDIPIATITATHPFADCSYGPDLACFVGVEHSGEVGVGISSLSFTGDWDWDHVQYGFVGDDIPPLATSYEWTTDGMGDWQDPNPDNNWTPNGGPPMDSSHTAVFGGMASGPTLVGVNSSVTVNRIEFDGANPYAIGGLSSVNLATDPDDPTAPNDLFGPPSLGVDGETAHQFQAIVNLQDDTTVHVESESTLSFNNALNLNGHNLDKTGSGTLLINNVLNSGGGTVTGLGGVIGGSGTVGGDLINQGGVVSPGYDPGKEYDVDIYIGEDLVTCREAMILKHARLNLKIEGRLDGDQLEIALNGHTLPLGDADLEATSITFDLQESLPRMGRNTVTVTVRKLADSRRDTRPAITWLELATSYDITGVLPP